MTAWDEHDGWEFREADAAFVIGVVHFVGMGDHGGTPCAFGDEGLIGWWFGGIIFTIFEVMSLPTVLTYEVATWEEGIDLVGADVHVGVT